ncbi:hypothetical protein D3C75_531730 [compost metagenome]
MNKRIEAAKADGINFGHFQDLGAPWSYVGQDIFFTHEDAGQGSHPPFPQLAMMNVRKHDGEMLEVVIGYENHIDKLIAGLQVLKARMDVQSKTDRLDMAKGNLAHLEKKLL